MEKVLCLGYVFGFVWGVFATEFIRGHLVSFAHPPEAVGTTLLLALFGVVGAAFTVIASWIFCKNFFEPES